MSIFNLLLLLFLIPGLNSAEIQASYSHGFSEAEPILNEPSSGIPQKITVGDMPLRVFGTTPASGLPMIVYISGDGGWNKFNASLCDYLNEKGIPVLALDAQKYFWERKTPEQAAADLTAAIEKYQKLWKRDKFVLTGFSFGADVLPFLLNRFPPRIKSRVISSFLISPDNNCDFEIHLSDMLNWGTSKGKYDVVREIQISDFKNFTAVFGSDEDNDTRQLFELTGAKVKVLQGDHHFDSSFEIVGDLIIAEMVTKEHHIP